MPFVKLDTGILESTLWIDPVARDIFITALLMAEPHELTEPAAQIKVTSLETTGFFVPPGWYGFIHAAGVGIVRRALMDPDMGLQALVALGNPDPQSRTAEFDGRRLVRVDGGFIVLNFFKYRDKDYTAAERMARLRARRKERIVTRTSDGVTRNSDVADSREQRAEAEIINTSSAKSASESDLLLFSDDHPAKKEKTASEKILLDKSFAAIWEMYPRKDSGKKKTREKYERAVRSTMNGDMRKQCVLIFRRIEEQIAGWTADKKDRQYIPMLSTYLNQQRFDEEVEQ